MSDAPFYVGYLPLPQVWRGFVRAAVAIAVVAMLAAAILFARAQSPAGDGTWADDAIVLEGVLTASPYPLLRAPDPESAGTTRAWLLVSSGKTGTFDRASVALGGAGQKRVRVHGVPLRRQGQRVLELLDGQVAIEVLGDAAPVVLEEVGPIHVVGEIIDPKCWLGAMRPGSGLVHRACAALCIRGGIPPCFIGGPVGTEPRFWILTDPAGRACNEALAERAGVLVRFAATRVREGEVDLLRVDPDAIATAEDER